MHDLFLQYLLAQQKITQAEAEEIQRVSEEQHLSSVEVWKNQGVLKPEETQKILDHFNQTSFPPKVPQDFSSSPFSSPVSKATEQEEMVSEEELALLEELQSFSSSGENQEIPDLLSEIEQHQKPLEAQGQTTKLKPHVPPTLVELDEESLKKQNKAVESKEDATQVFSVHKLKESLKNFGVDSEPTKLAFPQTEKKPLGIDQTLLLEEIESLSRQFSSFLISFEEQHKNPGKTKINLMMHPLDPKEGFQLSWEAICEGLSKEVQRFLKAVELGFNKACCPPGSDTLPDPRMNSHKISHFAPPSPSLTMQQKSLLEEIDFFSSQIKKHLQEEKKDFSELKKVLFQEIEKLSQRVQEGVSYHIDSHILAAEDETLLEEGMEVLKRIEEVKKQKKDSQNPNEKRSK